MVLWNDERLGLQISIIVDDTTLGPGIGGTRWRPFPTRTEALVDNSRLARDMTHKLAMALGEDTELAQAGVGFGGGKAVISGEPTRDRGKRKEQLTAYAQLINSLGGRYVTSIDVGTTVEDMIMMKEVTKWVAGLPHEMGGSGDPSPATAMGVVWGMKACLEAVFGTQSFKDRTIAIQGIAGKVGSSLARMLASEGAILLGSDINEAGAQQVAKEVGARLVPSDQIHHQQCDIFSANAYGGVLNDDTIPQLRCRIVAGAANNQLWEPRKHAAMLHDRGILHAPEFWINGGGVINVAHEFHPQGYSQDRAFADIKRIYNRGKEMIETSRKDKISLYMAAMKLAEERVRRARDGKTAS
ncbi:MAG: leucine dehydrogenase [Dehalococcoidia bacterium]|nr:leucine dehydrogenase [Dehalococcoidia bacterium]